MISVKKKSGGHVDYSCYVQTSDWNLGRLYKDVTNTGLGSYLYSTKQTYDFDVTDKLASIKIPVLLIHGKKDTILNYSNSVFMKKMMKNAKLVLLDCENHVLVSNDFPKVSKIMAEFL